MSPTVRHHHYVWQDHIDHYGLQVAATEEKTKLEVAQREALKDRQSRGEEWQTKLFLHDVIFQSASVCLQKFQQTKLVLHDIILYFQTHYTQPFHNVPRFSPILPSHHILCRDAPMTLMVPKVKPPSMLLMIIETCF